MDLVSLARGFLGVAGFILIAYLCSNNRKAINWRLVRNGLLLQFVIGLIVLNEPVRNAVFKPVDSLVQTLLGFSKTGADFVMQSVEKHEVVVFPSVPGPDGKPVETRTTEVVIGRTSPGAKTFATWVLPSVVFFSCVMTLLYYFGVMQPLVKIIARVIKVVMGTSGSETLSASANIFMGQTEAPLVVKPFVEKMTMSELHAIMVGGFATVAGGVLAMYAAVLQGIPGIAGHLVTGSCMAAPGGLVIAKILWPETKESETMGDLKMTVEVVDRNAIEAAARGASEGMGLLINIVAMLIAFVALVAMADCFTTNVLGLPFTEILGTLMWPVAALMGIPFADCKLAGLLLGEKLVLTELIAYLHLSGYVAKGMLTVKSEVMLSYALCGFANFASIGIQIGGIGAMAPSRKSDLAQLGVRAMFAGVITTCITGTIAGIFMTLGF